MSQLSSTSALSTPLSSQYLSSQNRPLSQLSSSAGSPFRTPLSSQGLSSQVSQSKPTPTSRHVATSEWTPECPESSQATQKRCATPFRPSFQPMSGRSTDRPTKAVRNLKREWQLEKKEDIVAQAARDSGIPIKKASSNASIALPPPKSRKPSVNQLGQSQHISSLESNHQQGLANSTCDTTATLAETLPPTDKSNQQCLATSTGAMGDSLVETVPPTHRSNKDQQGSVYSTGVMGDFLPDTVPPTGVSDINVQQHDLDTSNSIKPSLQHMENPPPVPTKDDRNTNQVDTATTSSNNESPQLIKTPLPSKKGINNENQLDTTTTSTINASPQLMKTPPPPIKQDSVFDLTGHTRPKTPAMRKELIKKLNESVCNKTMDESMACLTGVDWDVASQVVLNGKRAAKTVEYWQKHMEEQMKWLRIIHDGPCDRTRVVGFVMQSWQMMTSVFATFVPRPPEIQMVVERYASNCIKFYELFTLRGYEELSSVMMDFTQRVLARFLSAPVHMNELSHSWVYTRQVLRMMCQHPTNIDILLTLTATLDEIKMKFITTWSLGPTAPLDRNMEFITYSLQELVNLIVMANDRIQQLQRMDMHSIKC